MIIADFEPVIFSFGPLAVRWYGLMYVFGFVSASFLLKRLIKEGLFQLPKEKLDSLVTHVIISLFLGARIIYVFIYNPEIFQDNFWDIFAVWKGGLSFHGGLIGIIIGLIIFAKRNKIELFNIFDCICLVSPQGLFFGRVGNFINGELFGRVTTESLPWAMIFPQGGPYPRHPSQLYEALFEGLTLFLILWFLRKKLVQRGLISSIFLIGYGTARYFIEFFRQPDAQMGYYFGGTTTMGQILCLIMIASGILFYMYARKKTAQANLT